MGRFKAAFTVVMTVSLLGTVGCGGESEEDKARQVAGDYVVALNDKDDARACELQTASTRKDPVRGSCDLHSRGLLVPKSPETKNVDRNGDRAQVLVTGAGKSVTVQLVKEDGNWRVEGYEASEFR